jgi:hypothetical protein
MLGAHNKSENPSPLTRGTSSGQAREFLLKEYECLRKEIELYQQTSAALERNIVFVIGVSWAWLFSVRAEVPALAWLIPCLFALLGFIRALNKRRFSRNVHAYLMKVEDEFLGGHQAGGWEHWTDNRAWSPVSTALFWLLLILSTITVAWYEISLSSVSQPRAAGSAVTPSPSGSQNPNQK